MACKYGIDGMTCTPVAAEMTPLISPTMPPTHFSFGRLTLKMNFRKLTTA